MAHQASWSQWQAGPPWKSGAAASHEDCPAAANVMPGHYINVPWPAELTPKEFFGWQNTANSWDAWIKGAAEDGVQFKIRSRTKRGRGMQRLTGTSRLVIIGTIGHVLQFYRSLYDYAVRTFPDKKFQHPNHTHVHEKELPALAQEREEVMAVQMPQDISAVTDVLECDDGDDKASLGREQSRRAADVTREQAASSVEHSCPTSCATDPQVVPVDLPRPTTSSVLLSEDSLVFAFMCTRALKFIEDP